jgi:hypothetical protein
MGKFRGQATIEDGGQLSGERCGRFAGEPGIQILDPKVIVSIALRNQEP